MTQAFRRALRIDRSLLETLVSLYGIQVLTMLLPLMIWPWLARVLGPAQAGVVALSEAAARYIGMLVEYGFQLSATREIAQCRSDAAGRSRIISGVLSGQSILACLAAVVMLLAWQLSPALQAHPDLILASLVWGVAIGMNPIWYFQGTERMRFAATVEGSCRTAAVLLIFLLVKEPRSAWLAPAMNGAAMAAVALINWREVRRETSIRPAGASVGWRQLKSGFQAFLFRGAVSLYTTGNVLALGFLARPEAVGLFAVAEKFVKAGISAIYPISQTMYPRVARLLAGSQDGQCAARRAVTGSLRVTAALGVAVGLLFAFAGGWLVRLLFGPAYASAGQLVTILSIMAPLIGVSNVLGLQWMLPQRMERSMNLVLAVGAAVNLLLGIGLAPRFGAPGMCWAVVGAEATVTAGVMLSLLRAGRLPWNGLMKREGVVPC